MGTFHQDKGELHGITVLVTTAGPESWIGRCDTMMGEHVVLLGADRHHADQDEASLDEWVGKASMVGFFPRHERVLLPHAQVAAVRPLHEL
ncbi:hypothetical protein DRQ53_02470 [bacterium]|nr:MAG: hypothetical protein DRQ53_02470 [bacterium]